MSTEPTGAWRRLHPITILRELLGVAWNVVVAVIVLGALQDGGLERVEVLVPVAFFAVAIGRYYSTRYQVTPEAVLWRRGVLFRRRLEVPRSRIQNVSSGADVLGRIFGLRTVTISTAGSEGEIELALVTSEEASFLLADLLGPSADRWPAGDPTPAEVPPPVGPPPPVGCPAGRPPGPVEQDHPGPWSPPAGAGERFPPRSPSAPPPPVRRLVTLSAPDLARYALTGDGVWAVVVGAVVTVGLSITFGDARPLLFIAFAAAAPVMATLDLLDFELTAEADRVRVRHGLLKTRDKWARRERIQVVQVDRPLLRAALGYETVSVATADARAGDADLSLSAPLLDRGRWADLAGELVEAPAVAEADLRPISPRAELRRTLRLLAAGLAPVGVLAGVAWLAVDRWAGLVALVVGAAAGSWLARALARRAQQLDGYTADDQHLLVRRGMVGSRLWLVRRAKVQSVSLLATPFQRRLGLVSLHIDTANVGGAAIVVPDLPRPEAEGLAADLVDRADRVFLPDGV